MSICIHSAMLGLLGYRRTSLQSSPHTSALAAFAVVLLLGAYAPRPSAFAFVMGAPDPRVSILVYHRFGPAITDSTTIRTATFRWQLQYLKDHDYPVIPLRAVIAYLRGQGPAPPPHSVVVTADDGHSSVFTDMLPVVREYGIPVTLFIYPSAISNASYAMTWAQLQALHETGLFDIQSHTFWHPNFATEKRRLAPAAYRELATMQLCKSRALLYTKLGVEPDVVAWPFGIYDEELFGIARDCGYTAGVTIERRTLGAGEHLMALPRFMVADTDRGTTFAALLPSRAPR